MVRALMFMAMTGINFWALQYLQLTVTSSIFFSVPLIIALASASVLGEKLDAGRWIAILAGFAGVLVIVRPWGAEFHPAMLASVVNAILYAVFMMMTRRLAAYDSPETIQYLPAVGAAIGLAPFALAAWESPNGWLEWTRGLPDGRARRLRPLPARARAPLCSRLGDRALPLPAGDLHGARSATWCSATCRAPAVWLGARDRRSPAACTSSRGERQDDRERRRCRCGSCCWRGCSRPGRSTSTC